MELRFTVRAHISRPVATVFEAVADPDQLSGYFTTGGARGRLAKGATVTWDFHDYPGAFPVEVIDVVANERIVLRWAAPAPPGRTEVTIDFTPVGDDRTLVTITEAGWESGPDGLTASYGNCMGWSQMLAAMKAYVEYGINLREGMYV